METSASVLLTEQYYRPEECQAFLLAGPRSSCHQCPIRSAVCDGEALGLALQMESEKTAYGPESCCL